MRSVYTCGILGISLGKKRKHIMLKILKKMNVLLDGKQKRAMIALIIMMLIGGVLESLGVSMLVPIVTVVMDPEAISESGLLSSVRRWLYQ